MKNVFVKAVYAGVMIGAGGIVYLSLENKVIGSLLFSFGLLTIVNQGFFLYTGKIGFAKTKEDFWNIPVILAGNLVGTALDAVLVRMAHLKISADAASAAKLSNDPVSILILSIFCGVMMFLAIDNFNKCKNHLFIIAPVMIFILSGFEHSVANMFYFTLAGAWSGKAIFYMALMILGNGIGAQLFCRGKEWV